MNHEPFLKSSFGVSQSSVWLLRKLKKTRFSKKKIQEDKVNEKIKGPLFFSGHNVFFLQVVVISIENNEG